MISLSVASIAEKAKRRPGGYFEDVLANGTVINNESGEPEFVVFSQSAYKRLAEKYAADSRPAEVVSAAYVDTSGPGTELKALLAGWPFRIVSSPDCKCNQRAAYMDSKGCDWCESEQGMAEIMGFLREAAEERGLPFLDLPARLLVKRAIHNARKAEAKRAKEAEQAAAEGRPAV